MQLGRFHTSSVNGGEIVEHSSEEILQRLKEAGYKFTGKRKAIVDLFVRNKDRYLTAKDVFEQVKASYPMMSFDTVYRTLALLQEHNVIEQLEFNEEAAKYRLMCPASHHHHHLICVRCGNTSVVEDCPMSQFPTKINGFSVINHRFEIYGYCSSCTEVT
jgi:Fur family transcriptional regulator, zinc uptake regulator